MRDMQEDKLLAGINEICDALRISEKTFMKWRNIFPTLPVMFTDKIFIARPEMLKEWLAKMSGIRHYCPVCCVSGRRTPQRLSWDVSRKGWFCTACNTYWYEEQTVKGENSNGKENQINH